MIWCKWLFYYERNITLNSGRSIISLCCFSNSFRECYLINKVLSFLSLPSAPLTPLPSHDSWPSCGESQHRQDPILPGREVLCSEIWKVVFWVWGGDWRRHACGLGQTGLSSWCWAGGWWSSLCVWRQQGESGQWPHILSPSFFFLQTLEWKLEVLYWVSGSLASKSEATTTA